MTKPPFRIAARQAVATKAKQALMIGSGELGLFGYRQPYNLGYASQRAALLQTLSAEFGRGAELPDQPASEKQQVQGQEFATLVVYLVVADGEPILIPEVEVLPWVFGYVFAKAGRDVAQRVSYRAEMLTTVTT